MSSFEYGYDYIKDDSGKDYAVSRATGKVTDAVTITVPVGSTVRTPEQQRAYKEYWENQEKKKFYCRKIMDEYGYFYFVLCENQLGKLSAETAARLIYLATFLNYDNYFMMSQRQHMKKSDLQSVLGLSTGTTFKFWKEVSPLYVVEEGEGLKLSSTDIVRGEIKNKNNSYQRFYIDAIRKIYEKTEVSKHKHLGYVYKILPFINRQYNVLSWNPDEEVLDDIKPLSVEDFCQLIGYDPHDSKKLIKIYKKITFEVNHHQEYFLSYVTNDTDMKSARMFVNPRILYCGTMPERVEILGAFVKCDK